LLPKNATKIFNIKLSRNTPITSSSFDFRVVNNGKWENNSALILLVFLKSHRLSVIELKLKLHNIGKASFENMCIATIMLPFVSHLPQ
jgi:hypothetical protein